MVGLASYSVVAMVCGGTGGMDWMDGADAEV